MKIPSWPNGYRFAFSVFDDPDGQRTEVARQIYDFLADLGFRTTRGVWPSPTVREPSDIGENCSNPEHREWLRSLQARGFELGLHNVTNHTSTREETIRGFQAFHSYFGEYPRSLSNHFANDEGIYFGGTRLTGAHRRLYQLLTRGRYKHRFTGHDPASPYFWGDLCRQHVRYVRNFVFRDIDTLAMCPFMPYHDPLRPHVQNWFCSSEGNDVEAFVETLSERNQDRLAERGSACIMYAHFAKGFLNDGQLHARFEFLMKRLSRLGGWCVPVSELLDYIRTCNGEREITAAERSALERRWLLHKIRWGSA